MKIGIDALAADNRSGSGVYTWQLLRALSRIDSENEYHLFLGVSPKVLDIVPWPANFIPHRVLLDKTALRPLWVEGILPLRAQWLGLDVLHSPQFVGPFWGKTPLVVTIHDVVYERFPETVRRLHRSFYRTVVPRVVGHAKRIITDSRCSQKEIADIFHIPEESLAVIPLGVAKEYFRPIASAEVASVREKYHLFEDYILAVGTLEPRKNLVTLLRAFAQLRERGIEAELAVIGRPGWNYRSVMALSDSETFVDKVTFLGFVPFEDLYALYQGASAFAFPSLHEGFGLPLLEAMASGAPVVASGIPTSLDLLNREGSGLMVEAMDVKGWADALEDILRDKELAAHLGRTGRAVARSYTWERTARETLSVYKSLPDH